MVVKKVCTFCGHEIEPGTGIMLVENSGSLSFFCSSKCRNCVRLKRSARRVKWTSAYRKEKAIRVTHLKGQGEAAKSKAEEAGGKAESKHEAPKAEKKGGKKK